MHCGYFVNPVHRRDVSYSDGAASLGNFHDHCRGDNETTQDSTCPINRAYRQRRYFRVAGF